MDFVGTVWALLPPVIAIVLALITKEVYMSLFIGVVTGALLYTNFSPVGTIEAIFEVMMEKLGDSWIIWNLILESLVLKKADESDIDEIKGYNLRRLCEYVYTLYGGKKELTELLTSCFKGTKPDGNKFHLKLTSYPWKKIFTVNIDDLIENLYKANQKDYFVQIGRAHV